MKRNETRSENDDEKFQNKKEKQNEWNGKMCARVWKQVNEFSLNNFSLSK